MATGRRDLGEAVRPTLRRSLRAMQPVDEEKRHAGTGESGHSRSSQRIVEIVYGHED